MADAPDRPPEILGRRVRHEIVRRLLTVKRTEALTPRMIRIVLEGPELEGFHSPGFDDHAKLFFPLPGEEEPRFPGEEGGGPPAPMRDYTPRLHDPAKGELSIDFALHEAGPATEWAAAARPGSRLGVAGPRGSHLLPDDLDWSLLAGDETALPAIARRLAELPPEAKVTALIEVADEAEKQDLAHGPGARITWLLRNGAPAGTPDRLAEAVRGLRLPEGSGHAWIAGEIGVARELRRLLVDHHGLPRARVKAAGYWRLGAVAAHEPVSD